MNQNKKKLHLIIKESKNRVSGQSLISEGKLSDDIIVIQQRIADHFQAEFEKLTDFASNKTQQNRADLTNEELKTELSEIKAELGDKYEMFYETFRKLFVDDIIDLMREKA